MSSSAEQAQYSQVPNDYDEHEMGLRAGIGSKSNSNSAAASNSKQNQVHEFQPLDNQLEMLEDEHSQQPSQRQEQRDLLHHTLMRADSARQVVIEEQNLDEFFAQVYKYFYEKGFWNLLLARLLKLFSVLFVIAFSTLILVFVNWKELWSCQQEACKNVQVLYIPSEFTTFHLWVIVFESVFLLYWFSIFVQYVIEVGNMLRVKAYFNDKLNVNETDIQTITWHEVVQKFILVQREQPISRVKPKLDEKDIVNLIMRKENYLIAFLNKQVLNLSSPFSLFVNNSSGRGSASTKTPIMTESLLWNLRYIISHLFDSEYKIKSAWIKNPNELRWKFIYLGVVNFLAAPFLLVYLIVYLFFKYTAELRELGLVTVFDRRWTTYAKWRFREFNELQHVFEERMKKSVAPARNYMRQFPAYYLSIIAKLVMFLSSGFAAMIIIMTAVKSDLFLYITLLNQNLVWWLSMLMLIYFNAKSLVIDENQVFDPNFEMQQVCECTHYYPLKWKGKAHMESVRKEFCRLFQFALVVLWYELSSIIITPFILCFSIPKSCEKLAMFIDAVTVEEEGLGHVCGYATFSLDKHGNPRYLEQLQDQDKKKADDTTVQGEQTAKDLLKGSMHSSHGKMEQSLLSFKVHHPGWQPAQREAEFIEKMKKLDNEANMAMMQAQQQQQLQQQNTMLQTIVPQPVQLNQMNLSNNVNLTIAPHDNAPMITTVLQQQQQQHLQYNNASVLMTPTLAQQQQVNHWANILLPSSQNASMLHSSNRLFNMLESLHRSSK